MKYVKLTILLRSLDTLYDYNKVGRSFWEDTFEKVRALYGATIMESGGKARSTFYFPYEEKDDLSNYITDAVQLMGVAPEKFIVSVTAMNTSDMERLKKTNADEFAVKPWILEAEASLLESAEQSENDSKSASPTTIEENTCGANETNETQRVEEGAKTSESMDGQSKNAQGTNSTVDESSSTNHGFTQKTNSSQKDDGDDECDSSSIPASGNLAEEASRIGDLRAALLSAVHGQRHAVDEVVQTIFECDAFNTLNENRRGPLATFLFTGPSGVGKTFLATQCAERLGRASLVVDMSEFSDNLANNKFNGEHDQPAIVTGFVRKNPNGIIIFDEIEKAHINTIYLFLQILDSGRLMDMRVNKEVSFRDTIVFITTNAGSSLYDDPTVVDLSNVSRRAILEALRTDLKPGSNDEPYFPECITTRFANGHVILFNHLEPYALMQIVRDEIDRQVGFFRKAYDVEVKYDPAMLSALVLYSTGGLADARSLRGTAKNMIVKELQDIIMQTYRLSGDGVNDLKTVEITIEPERAEKEVQELFSGHEKTHVPVFADEYVIEKIRPVLSDDESTEYEFFNDPDKLKRRVRGVVDYVLLDPAAGSRPMKRTPNDLEDVDADGMDLFRYIKEYYPDIPVYLLDVRGHGEEAFSSLLAKGGRGVVSIDTDSLSSTKEQIKALAFSALVNNSTFRLGRSGRILTYNCSQYNLDESKAVVAFDRLALSYAPSSTDDDVTFGGDKNGVTFADVIGCKEAKKALGDFCKYIEDPRKLVMQGKKIPKGVLLYGPPGTGKTLLAKAMANEAKAAFIPTTATSFFGSYVGESERNVRELFRRARRYAPAIIFIDEADAIARARTGSTSTAHNEDTLNAFIAEMDGFSTDEKRPVFVIAATNYEVSGDGPRVLDGAFVRRFDRKVYVDLPDADERFELVTKELLRHGVDFGEESEALIKNFAARSSGMSNADLVTVIDIFLRNTEDKEPTGAALMDALDNFRFGEVNELDPAELRQTACHESGHALVARILGETPSFLTVVSRGNFGGFMEHSNNEKKGSYTYGELMDRVCVSLAGRIAEIEVYGKDSGLNTGASSDLAHARYVIKTAFNTYAMGEKLFTEGTDEECEKLMRAQFDRTAKLIASNRDTLEKLTDLLTEKKSLDEAELNRFFDENLKK